jgi:hypothetical protein
MCSIAAPEHDIEAGDEEGRLQKEFDFMTVFVKDDLHAWRALGHQVRRGEHGVKVVTFVTVAGKDSKQDRDGIATNDVDGTNKRKGFRRRRTAMCFMCPKPTPFSNDATGQRSPSAGHFWRICTVLTFTDVIERGHVSVIFNHKADERIRAMLKAHGFRRAPAGD